MKYIVKFNKPLLVDDNSSFNPLATILISGVQSDYYLHIGVNKINLNYSQSLKTAKRIERIVLNRNLTEEEMKAIELVVQEREAFYYSISSEKLTFTRIQKSPDNDKITVTTTIKLRQ